jgi:YHS domain-containing protein
MKLLRILLASLFISSAAVAADLVNVDRHASIALQGYDPVAFFTQGAPAKGDPSIQAEYQGAQYLFTSTENRDAFQKEPAKYAPQFGGYCAFGVAKGALFPVDASTWVIRDGKLYLNYSADVAKLFAKDTAALLRDAETNWPNLVKKHVQ